MSDWVIQATNQFNHCRLPLIETNLLRHIPRLHTVGCCIILCSWQWCFRGKGLLQLQFIPFLSCRQMHRINRADQLRHMAMGLYRCLTDVFLIYNCLVGAVGLVGVECPTTTAWGYFLGGEDDHVCILFCLSYHHPHTLA
jgi:hypothetical protein